MNHRSLLIGSPLLNFIQKAASLSSPGGSSSTMTLRERQCLSEISPHVFREAMKRGSLLAATVSVCSCPAIPDGFLARTICSVMESPGRSRRLIEYWEPTDYQLSLLLDLPNTVLNGAGAWFHGLTSHGITQQVTRQLPAILFNGWRGDLSPECGADSLVLNLSGGPIPATCSKPTSSTSKCSNTGLQPIQNWLAGFEILELSEWRSN